MRARRIFLGLCLGVVAGLAAASVASQRAQVASVAAAAPLEPPSSPELLARGAAVLATGDCGRCHAVSGLAVMQAAPRARSCTGCHAWIHATADDAAARTAHKRDYPLWDRYVVNVRSFLDVPDLGVSAARLDRTWMARYLRAPYNVRPGLPEAMIRTAFSHEDAEAAAAWLAATGRARLRFSEARRAAAAVPVSTRADDIATGAALFSRLSCSACHALGARAATPGMPGAPDLLHARERMRADDIAALIADPAAFGIEDRMPSYQLSAGDAARLRDFLLASADARATPAAAPPPQDAPLLQRRVAYEEVRERVFAAICIHCHMDPARNTEGGPGNTGGLTYAGAGLDLETWEGVRRGAFRDGARVSILDPPPGGGEPVLIARLRVRAIEYAGERAGSHAVTAGGAPGMPLGLAPLSPEQLQLVRSWLAQGAPGPRVAAR